MHRYNQLSILNNVCMFHGLCVYMNFVIHDILVTYMSDHRQGVAEKPIYQAISDATAACYGMDFCSVKRSFLFSVLSLTISSFVSLLSLIMLIVLKKLKQRHVLQLCYC